MTQEFDATVTNDPGEGFEKANRPDGDLDPVGTEAATEPVVTEDGLLDPNAPGVGLGEGTDDGEGNDEGSLGDEGGDA